MPDVQPKAGQETVDFLRHLQERNGAQKPYQNCTGNSFFARGTDRGFYIALGNSKRVS